MLGLVVGLMASAPAHATSCSEECLETESFLRCHPSLGYPLLVGDIDGDGDMDLLARVQTFRSEFEEGDTDGAAWFEQRLIWHPLEDGVVGAEREIEVGPEGAPGYGWIAADDMSAVAQLVDLDGDGHLDILGNGHQPRREEAVPWWRNDGEGGFTRLELPVTSADTQFGVRDIDQDGLVDLLTEGAGGVRVMWNDGDGAFSAGPLLPIESSWSIVMVDIDGDGARELLALVLSRMRVFEVEGREVSGPGDEVRAGTAPWGGARPVVAIDLDGDGDEDLVTPDVKYLNDQGRLLEVVLEGSGVDRVAVHDVDADGHDDVVRWGSLGGLYVHYSDGTRVTDSPVHTFDGIGVAGWLTLGAEPQLAVIDGAGRLVGGTGEPPVVFPQTCGDVTSCLDWDSCVAGCSTLTLVVPFAWTPLIFLGIRWRRERRERREQDARG